MKKRFLNKVGYLVLCILISTVAVAGYGAAAEPIKIGATLPFTGSCAQLAKHLWQGMVIAQEEINASGGVKGQPLEMIQLDDGMEPGKAVANVRRLIDRDSVVCIMGSITSPCSLAVNEITATKGIPQICAMSAAVPLTEPTRPNLFRMIANDKIRARAYLTKAKEMGWTKIGVLYDNTAWGKSQRDTIKQFASEYGCQVVSDIASEGGTIDFTIQVSKLKASSPDVVIISVYEPEGASFMKARYAAGWKVPVFQTGPLLTSMIPLMSKAEMEGAMAPDEIDPTKPEAVKFFDKYEKRWGKREVTVNTAWGYDTVYMVAEAIKVGGATPKGIIHGLDNIKGFPTVSGGQGSSVQYSSTNHDFMLATGFAWYKLQDGAKVYLK